MSPVARRKEFVREKAQKISAMNRNVSNSNLNVNKAPRKQSRSKTPAKKSNANTKPHIRRQSKSPATKKKLVQISQALNYIEWIDLFALFLQVQHHIENQQMLESDDELQWSRMSPEFNNANDIQQQMNVAPLMAQKLGESSNFSMAKTSNATPVRLKRLSTASNVMQRQSIDQGKKE